jgi:NAD(P)-dependent dehydrogenase (short-subunit alcohol dehydrogenase family)
MALIDLAGRTALVTGAAKRVGREIAHELAGEGVDIIVHYNSSASQAGALVEELRDRGVQAWALQAALDDPLQVRRMWEQAAGCVPQGRVSLLVNNASIFPSDTLDTVDLESLDENLRVNALAPLQLIRLFARQKRSAPDRSLRSGGAPADSLCAVNLLDSRIGGYMKKHVSYALSKRALFSLTRMLALELAPDVRVNAVAPGMILAPDGQSGEALERLAAQAPLARWGAPEDVANAVIFLMRNDYLTGQVIYVDGGAFIKEALYG